METNKTNFAFISYAREDKEIADEMKLLLKNALSKFKREGRIFIDTNDYTPNWRRTIKEAIPHSNCFIPIFTTNSIHSQWVNYELGIATANNIPIYPIIKKPIRPEQITCSEDKSVYLEEIIQIRSLLEKIFDIEDSIQKKNLDTFLDEQENIIQRIILKFSERHVYIVGSLPTSIKLPKEINDWQKRAEFFLSTLTGKLLNDGYHLTSFPTVDYVGKVVIKEIINEDKIDNYSIAGLYGMDKNLKENRDKGINRLKWDEIISKYRMKYLQNQDYIIVIGGNENTKEELYAAQNIKSIIFIPIPCFNGASEDKWKEFKIKNQRNCLNHSLCEDYKKCIGNCDKIENIIEKMNCQK